MKSTLFKILSSVLAVSLLAPISLSMAVADDTTSLVDQINIEYEQFTLDNGLTVLVYSDHAVPTVFVAMYYGVGAKDEPPGKTGFAHLFEHLMFQGTENREGEYVTPFTQAGATGMNGTTGQDRTNYFATVPTGALDMALWMESDRMTYLLGAIDQAALDEQRDVVKNEKRQRENRPYHMVYQSVLEGLFPVGHPYHHTIIGSMEDLDAASLEDVHAWFEKYYGGTNSYLVLAGDVTVEQAKEKVAFYFNEAPVGEPLIKPEKWVPTLDAIKREKAYDRVGQIRLVRAWVSPDTNDPDASLFYLMNQTLVGNKNAPLYKKLVDELKLATNVRASAMAQVLSGMYIMIIDLVPGVDPEQVWSIVDETIAEYINSGPDSNILAASKLGVNKRVISSMESKSFIGSRLISGALFNNDPLYFKKELKWMNEASEADLQRVAREWLRSNYYQLEVHPFPEVASGEPQADRTGIPAVGEVGGVTFPEIQETTLKNGLRLVVAERDAIPLVNVQIVTRAGRTTTGKVEDSVLGEASWILRDRGTAEYENASELAAAQDAIAMDTNLSSGDESSTLSYSILSSFLGESLVIANELLVSPTYPEGELAKFRTQTEAFLANREKNPGRSVGSYHKRAIWGEDKAIASIWTTEHLAQLTSENLDAFNRAYVVPSSTTIYMVGDIDLKQAEKAVNKAFGKWRSKAEPQRVAIGEALPPRARVILVDQPGSVQAIINAGHKVPAYDPETWTELSVINGVFGGSFDARINMNLREDKGWSYGMRSRIDQNTSGDMVLTVSGSVQIDKAAESMQEIMKEYREFVSTRPGTPAEFDREVLNGTRSIPGRYETSGGVLASIVSSDANGLPMDYAESEADRLAALTLEGINVRAKEILKPDQLTWVVVGDLSQMEEKIRALKYGEVEIWDHNGNKLR
jgi:zinc protease